MQTLAERDYFSDHSILRNPYAYFEAIRAKGPIYTLPGSGIVVVTEYDEMLEVLRNTADFSSVLAPQGPAAPLPFEPQGPRQHASLRSLLSRLFTPSRLRANEQFIAEYSDQLVKDAAA